MQELVIRTASSDNQPSEPHQPSFLKHFTTAVWHFAALVIWVYTVVKLFVYDIDNFLIQTYFPRLSWLLEYKFFLVIGIFSIALIMFGKAKTLLFVLFTSFYPLIVLVWYVPRFVLKTDNWMFLVALLNSLLSFFKSFRSIFVSTAAGLISIAVVYGSHNEILLYMSAAVLGVLLTAMYMNRFVIAFRPFGVIRLYESFFGKTVPQFFTKQQKLDESIRALTVGEMNETQLTTFRTSLQFSLLVNRACLFVAKLLREYKRSGFSYLSGAVTTFLLFIATIGIFAGINAALFKIDSASFEFKSVPSAFTFLHYSFETMCFSSIRELTAVSTKSYVVNMTQKLFAVLLIPMLISQIIVGQKQRFTEELDQVITRIEYAGNLMEQFIFEEYKVGTFEEALAEIERLKGNLVRILLFLTEKLNNR
jgi:hypothetical protein